MNETLGASFSIDVTDLKTGLSQANRLIRESESEFKAAAAGMDNWTKSQEGLESRLKHLNTAADLQRQKVDALQSEYDRLIADGLDPTSKQAVELRTKINKETEALNKNESEIRKQTKALEELENESDEAGDAVRDTGDAAEDAGDGFTVAKGAIATFIGNGLTALTDAAKNAIGSIMGLAESTREYRTIMASLENSSKLAGYSVAETEATFKQLNGVLGNTQGAATTTANLQAIGLEQSKLQELTNGVIGAWAKYGDSIPIDGLAEAVNHTAQLGEVQGTLSDVIEWGGGSVDDFNKKLAACSTETERANLIAKLLADEGLTEAGEAWQENNESIVDANNAQAEYEKNTAALGAKIEPITTKIREGFNAILEKILELVGGVDFGALGASIESAFAWFTDEALPVIVDMLGWIVDNKDILIAGVAGLGAAMMTMNVANMIMGVVNAFKAFKAANEGATVAQWLLNAAMNANPIGIIVAAIAGLVTAFVVLWNKCDAFREFWIGLWDTIKKTASVVLDWLKSAFKSVGEFFTNIWTGLKNGAVAAWNGVKSAFANVGAFFSGIKDKILSVFNNIKEKFLTIGKNVVQGIWEGINKSFDWIKGKIKKWVGNVTDFIKKLFGIKSPSRVMRDSVGKPIVQGIAQGIEKNTDIATSALEEMGAEMLESEKIYLAEKERLEKEAAEKELAERLATAKDAKEIEKIKQEEINKAAQTAQTEYLEGLKATAEEEKKAYETIVDTATKALENLQKTFENLAEKMFDYADATYTEDFKLDNGGLATQKRTLEHYNAVLEKLNSLYGEIPEILLERLSGMSTEEGAKYAKSLMKAGEEGYFDHISLLESIKEVSAEVGAKLIPTAEIAEATKAIQAVEELSNNAGGGLTVYQTNHYKQAYTSRIEQYKSKQQLYAAARLVKVGAI